MAFIVPNLFAQNNTITGIYARVEKAAVGSTAFKGFSSELKLQFPTLSSGSQCKAK
jgi:hypothetical protein